MFVFISHLTVPVEDQAALEQHFRERSRLVDDFAGFLYSNCSGHRRVEHRTSFLTAWKDRESFKRYMNSAEHATSHAREPADIMQRTTVRHEAYDVLMDSRGEPEWLR